MSKREDIFLLIQSLTVNEKKYFKLYYSKNKNRENKAYIRFFDTIAKQEQYDEKAVRQKLKGETIDAYFPSAKRKLWNMIVESLRAYQSEGDVELMLGEMLLEAKIMYDKHLFYRNYEILLKATDLAIEYERWNMLGIILGRRLGTLMSAFDKPEEKQAELRNVSELWNSNLKRISTSWDVLSIYVGIGFTLNYPRHSGNADEQKRLMQLLETLSDDIATTGKECALTASYTRVMASFEKKNYPLIAEMLLDIIRNCDPNSRHSRGQQLYYYNAYVNLINVLVIQKKYEEAKEHSDTLLLQLSANNHTQLSTAMLCYCLVLHAYTLNREKARALKVISQLEKMLVEGKSNFNSGSRLMMIMGIVRASCFLDSKTLCVSYLNRIYQGEEPATTVKDILFARLIEIILYFKAEDYDFLESLQTSLARFRKKNQDTLQAFAPLCEAIRQYCSEYNDKSPAPLVKYFSSSYQWEKLVGPVHYQSCNEIEHWLSEQLNK